MSVEAAQTAYLLLAVLALVCLVATLVTGAFFSRSLGTRMGVTTVALAVGSILALAQGTPHPLALAIALYGASGLLALLGAFVAVAALGGER